MLAKRHWSLHLWSLCCSWLAEVNLAFVHKGKPDKPDKPDPAMHRYGTYGRLD